MHAQFQKAPDRGDNASERVTRGSASSVLSPLLGQGLRKLSIAADEHAELHQLSNNESRTLCFLCLPVPCVSYLAVQRCGDSKGKPHTDRSVVFQVSESLECNHHHYYHWALPVKVSKK